MDGFRNAVFARLNGDAVLTSLLATTTSIYHRRAPLNAAFPFIVFFKDSGVPIWAFADAPVANQVWMFKGVDRSFSSSKAEDINKRMDLVLTDANLTLSDGTLLYIKRESDIDYEEGRGLVSTDPDTLVHHIGGLYRVFIDRA